MRRVFSLLAVFSVATACGSRNPVQPTVIPATGPTPVALSVTPPNELFVLQPSPGMEPTRGQSQEPQERPQRNKVTGTIHGSQDPDFCASVGQAL